MPALWSRARAIASRALAGSVYPAVGWATHYHANYVVPKWARTLAKTAQVGLHIFYRWPGARGSERAFTQPYGGTEAVPSAIAATLLDEPNPMNTGAAAAAVSLSERPVLTDDAAIRPAPGVKGPVPADATKPAPSADTNRWVIKEPPVPADAAEKPATP
jgi:hypothetical protein